MKTSLQKIIGVLALGVIAFALAFWLYKENTNVTPTVNNETGKTRLISVVATFYPLEELARLVGGERVTVRSIVPAGAEPHDYEPSQKDILAAYEADIFLLNGAGIDPWAEKIRPELERRGVKVIQMSELVSLLPAMYEDEEDQHEGEEINDAHSEEGESKESEFDPHYWLDPVWMEEEVRAITDALMARDSTNREGYIQRRDALLAELRNLDQEYQSGLIACRLDTVITSHNAFSYLSKRYGFTTVSISGISPEAEPSPRRLVELAQMIQVKGIRHIFFETLVSPKVSETLARETGAQTLVFNPLEGLTKAERAAGENYFTLMRQNLANLQTALQCQR